MRIGEMKFWAERFLNYVARVSWAVTVLASMKILAIDFWWLLLLVPPAIAWAYVDFRYVGPGELQAGMKRNPEWIDMRADIRAIKDKMGVK